MPSLHKLKQESWWGTQRVAFNNEDDQIRWFETIPSDQLVVIAEADDVAIGVAIYSKIDWLNRSLQISGSVFKEHRSKWARNAFYAGLDFTFEMLNMRRVESEPVEYNLMALNLEVGILGFKVEGRKRQSVYKCGRYYDSIVIGLLRSEWEQSERVKAYGDTCNKNFSHDFSERMIKRISQANLLA